MNRPWMPLYIADYLADTAHLNATQSGAYLHLIMHYWQTNGLPDDDQALARIARMTTGEWRKNRAIIAAFFGTGWQHKRIDAELAHAAEISSKRRASAEQRYSKRNANADQMQTHAGASSPSPIPEANASGAGRPVYADSKHELWGEGVPILTALGVPERSARSNVGRWLKDAKDDAQAVLGAIQRARDHRVIDPIPWITRALNTTGTRDAPTAKRSAIIEHLDRRIEEFREAEREPTGGAGAGPGRLLSHG